MHRKLEEAVKAMVTSLPLVSELRHPAMRHRHWRQLMKVPPTLSYTLSSPFLSFAEEGDVPEASCGPWPHLVWACEGKFA